MAPSLKVLIDTGLSSSTARIGGANSRTKAASVLPSMGASQVESSKPFIFIAESNRRRSSIWPSIKSAARMCDGATFHVKSLSTDW